MDNIYALASGHLPCAIAIIRLSGPSVQDILQVLIGKVPPPRYLHYAPLREPSCFSNPCYNAAGQIIDYALTVFFPSPYSFTGEDCAEFHLHGGFAVVNALLNCLSSFKNCRHAEAGEFTKRAFLNNRIDLTQAEGLADLLSAETEVQRRLALSGVSGTLAAQYRSWRETLLKSRAFCEALFDFSEEEEVESFDDAPFWEDLFSLKTQIKQHICEGERIDKLKDGLKVVIVGAPNAGKSSFINALMQKDVALVSEEAGTTRDIIETQLLLGGHKIFLSDTAGLRKTDNKLEQMGIDQAIKRIQEADLLLYLEDLCAPSTIIVANYKGELWKIGTKLDLVNPEIKNRKNHQFYVSAKTGEGIENFLKKLESHISSKMKKIGNFLPARQRQIELLKETVQQLEQALGARSEASEIAAEHLRLASQALGRITGDIDVEDMLTVIFSQFCVGK